MVVPYDLHRYVIGQKGKDVREMMTNFDVNIKSKSWISPCQILEIPFIFTVVYSLVPSAEQQSDVIQISGPASKVDAARQALLDRVAELEKERDDRVLRSFAVHVRNLHFMENLLHCSIPIWFHRLKCHLNTIQR